MELRGIRNQLTDPNYQGEKGALLLEYAHTEKLLHYCETNIEIVVEGLPYLTLRQQMELRLVNYKDDYAEAVKTGETSHLEYDIDRMINIVIKCNPRVCESSTICRHVV
jgi:hypothetical protein